MSGQEIGSLDFLPSAMSVLMARYRWLKLIDAIAPFVDYPDDFFDVDDDKPVEITVLGRNLKDLRHAMALLKGTQP